MYLYLMQHAEAAPKEQDPERGLTAAGRAAAKKTAAFFKRQQPEIHVIWHSGKARAEQTAAILAEALGLGQRVMMHTGLAPNDDIRAVREKLEKSGQNNIVIVGHLPFLSRLAAALLAGKSGADLINFRPGGIVCLAREEGRWRILWAVVPELLA
jgi:phosphohistidine phosphatase